MSFLTYESTRPWAAAIKAAVSGRKMPPWYADPQHGRFSNDRSLTAAEIDTLVRWVDAGAPMGNPADVPAPIQWPDGWQIAPDHIVTAPTYTIPAMGTIEWGYVVVPSGFTKDTWITSIEVRPGDRRAVHHVVVFVKPHSPDVPYNVFFWDQKKRDERGVGSAQPFQSAQRIGSNGATLPASAFGGSLAAVYVPGGVPQNFGRHRSAKLIPANSDLVLQVHYQATGREVTEATKIGFDVVEQAPERRFLTLAYQPQSIMDPKTFRIPAGAANWSSPPVELDVAVDAELVWMMPHMHARGKDMTYTITYPDGRKEIALHVPSYDFEWQLGYEVAEPRRLPKGTKIRVDAHFDNSVANRGNPDARVDVYGGTQTWEEMMNPWFGIVIDRDVAPGTAILTRATQGGG
jgi:hypothetical protein